MFENSSLVKEKGICAALIPGQVRFQLTTATNHQHLPLAYHLQSHFIIFMRKLLNQIRSGGCHNAKIYGLIFSLTHDRLREYLGRKPTFS